MEERNNFRRLNDFNAIALSIASPDTILGWSNGEVTKPETINYRTQKPEFGGLFCERIFGPVKNFECACGKYKRVRYKGVVCEKCGVEVIHSKVRRERMGHIKLAVPVTHTWFLRSTPSKLGLLLDLPVKRLEQVVYFASYIIIDVNEKGKEDAITELNAEYEKLMAQMKDENAASIKAAKKAVKNGAMKQKDFEILETELVQKLELVNESFKKAKAELNELVIGVVLTETAYREISMKFGHVFRAGIGAEAIREIVQKIDLPAFLEQMKVDYSNSSGQKQKKIIKRMKLAGALLRSGTKPEWMVMTVIPVLPPDLRPMVQLDGGRFATSDLNDLYRRVINRNARLKKLIQLGAPEIICRNEKRMLQESVDILISNSVRNSRSGMNYVQRRKLKSLSDMLKGKQGRFRQNLLGKRVDYSGRSVIVVGPKLRLDECGLPKYIMMELFKPFVIARLIEFELAFNVRSAEKIIRANEKIVWDILDEVIQGKYVLLNRAPTLHRMGIQAFRPQLVEGKAIQLHPLVCAAFNADFDGDQMAVHLPLSEKAQAEARDIMCSAKNLLKPSSGEPIINPSQDMVLGCYFLTDMVKGKLGEGMSFASSEAAERAFSMDMLDVQAEVKIRIDGEMHETTFGRARFNQLLPAGYPYKNERFGKKQLQALLADVYNKYDIDTTAQLADSIKDVGFEFATKSGVSISVFDIKSPASKPKLIEAANAIVTKINEQYQQGLMTDEERYNNTIRIWGKVKNDVTQEMIKEYDDQNDVYYQVNSGARGNWGQITQMAGMKGLVASPSGRTIELPIRSNLKEGFTILEYFIATHGGRKGKSDTALKTAEAGYLTRRLVDSVQDLIVREENCETIKGREITKAGSEKLGVDFESRIHGRCLSEDTKKGKKVIAKAGTIIDEMVVKELTDAKIEVVSIRTPMHCQTHNGVCQKCYGYDLGNQKVAKEGTPVGIIAAQSIGEPGTQLTMRTFHMGGIATEGDSITQGLTRVEELFEARTPKNPAKLSEIAGVVSIKRTKAETRITIQAAKAEDDSHHIIEGYDIVVKKGEDVKVKQVIAKSTTDNKKIRARSGGKVKSVSPVEIVIKQDKPQQRSYVVHKRAMLRVKDGEKVAKGAQLTSGHIDLRELMELTSVDTVQQYILSQVHQIYSSQGQDINEKHLEIIVRQMVSKVRIIESGDSKWLPGEIKDFVSYSRTNEALMKKKPMIAERLLLGLTRISLWTDSWLSAASFQETIRVLVEAATTRKIDTLEGLKENVIIGRLIPAGEGFNIKKAKKKTTKTGQKKSTE